MNKFLEEKKTFIYFLIVLLFLLLVLFYVYSVLPIKKDEATAKEDVKNLENEIKILEAKLENLSEGGKENSEKLERRVPNKRLVDQLLLSIQEAEYMSESYVKSITFTNYDGIVSENEEIKENTAQNSENGTETDEQNNNSQTESDGKTNQKPSSEENAPEIINDPNKPENLKTITFTLEIISPDFDHFLKFLQELEKLERINKVDSLTFRKRGEKEILFEDAPELIAAQIQLTTFYHK